jgi:hypothetical protein
VAVAQLVYRSATRRGLGVVVGNPDDGDALGGQVEGRGLEDLLGLGVQRGGAHIQQQGF